MLRTKLAAAAAAVLAVIAVPAWVVTRPGAEPPTQRQATEPPATRFVARGGSDEAPCTRDEPCATLDRAYRAAAPGEVVEIGPGRYPDQSLTDAPPANRLAPVVLRPARGAAVTVRSLHVEGASNVTFRRLRVPESVEVVNTEPSMPGSHDVAFEDVRAQTIKVIGRVSAIRVRGGVYGDTVDWQPQIVKYNLDDPDSSRPRDVLIDGVTFQNFRRSGPDSHTECLQVLNVDELVVRNSRFNNCDGTGDVGITNGPSDDVTFENNFMGKAGDAYYSMQITKNVHNLVLRYNSASKAAVFSDTETGGPYTIAGNYMPFSSGLCDRDGAYSHNVFAGGTCGPTDLNVPAMRFVDETGFDLHLAPNSEAIDRGDRASHPRTDIDGQPRTGVPDAGADERR